MQHNPGRAAYGGEQGMTVTASFKQPQLNIRVQPSSENVATGTPIARSVVYSNDYSALTNKPQINSVTLDGNLSAADLGLGCVHYDTSANWALQPALVAKRSEIYIYSDYEVIYDEVGNPTYIAGIKIGDGTSYLADMPFITDEMTAMLLQHIGNNAIHLTAAEREFWNNKISCYLDNTDAEVLILSKTNYIVEE